MILYTQIIKLNCDCKVVMIFVIFEILSIQKKKWFSEHHERPRVFVPTVRMDKFHDFLLYLQLHTWSHILSYLHYCLSQIATFLTRQIVVVNPSNFDKAREEVSTPAITVYKGDSLCRMTSMYQTIVPLFRERQAILYQG